MSVVFDTEALLAFYLGEPGGREVENRLSKVAGGEVKGYLNIITLTELYYILHRKSPSLAEEKEQNLRGYGLKIVPVDDDSLWKEAAKMKSKGALSLADALAAATAKMMKASLLTGRDEEFQGLDISIERIKLTGEAILSK